MQSRRMSAVETCVTVLTGYLVSLVATLLVLPAFGYAVSLADAGGITLVFTALSLVRTYAVRRVFNWLHARNAPHL